MPRRQIQPIDFGGQISRLVEIDCLCVVTPLNRLLSHLNAWNGLRFSACNRIEIRLFIRPNANHLLTVRRKDQNERIDSLRRDRHRLSLGGILEVNTGSVTWFLAGENEAPAIWKPPRPAVIDGVVSERLGLTGPGRKKNELGGRGGRTGNHPFAIRRHGDGKAVPQADGRGVTDLSLINRVVRTSAFTRLGEEQFLAIGRDV